MCHAGQALNYFMTNEVDQHHVRFSWNQIVVVDS
jgi:hypothetical protein